MPETADKPTPKCPICAGASELKQVLRFDSEYHFFFRCVVCTTVFPIVEQIGRPQPG